MLVYPCANCGRNSVFKSAPLFLFTVIYLDCGVCLLNICSLTVGVIVFHNGRVITDLTCHFIHFINGF